MKNIVRASALALALAVSATNGEAADVTTKRKYYDISGTTAYELGKQMAAKGPKRDKSQGFKRSWAQAQYPTMNVITTNPCRVKVGAVTILPRWKNKSKGSARLQKLWENFIAIVTAHEDQHVSHVKDAVQWL